MAEKEYVVLYTSQKSKKAKTWHDGTLKIPLSGSKAVLFDDKKIKLDSVYIKPEDVIPGEQLESDRYFILVEELKSGSGGKEGPTNGHPNSTANVVTIQRPILPSTNNRSSVRQGLKRKNSGFIPPRMIKQPKQDFSQDEITDNSSLPSVPVNNFPAQQAARPDIFSLYGTSKPQNKEKDISRTEPNTLSHFMSKLKNISPDITGHQSQGRSLSPWSTYGTVNIRSKQEPPDNDSKITQNMMGCENSNQFSEKMTKSDLDVKTVSSSKVDVAENSKVHNKLSENRTKIKIPSCNMSSMNSKRTTSQIMALLKSTSGSNLCSENNIKEHVSDESSKISSPVHKNVIELYDRTCVKLSDSVMSSKLDQNLNGSGHYDGKSVQPLTKAIIDESVKMSHVYMNEMSLKDDVNVTEFDKDGVTDQNTSALKDDENNLLSRHNLQVRQDFENKAIAVTSKTISVRDTEFVPSENEEQDISSREILVKENYVADDNSDLTVRDSKIQMEDKQLNSVELEHNVKAVRKDTLGSAETESSCNQNSQTESEQDNEDDNDESVDDACFQLTFSPLSHVTDSDVESSPSKHLGDLGSVMSCEGQNDLKTCHTDNDISNMQSRCENNTDSVLSNQKKMCIASVNGTDNLSKNFIDKENSDKCVAHNQQENIFLQDYCMNSDSQSDSQFSQFNPYDKLEGLKFSQDSLKVQSLTSEENVHITYPPEKYSEVEIDIYTISSKATNKSETLPFSDAELVRSSQVSDDSVQNGHTSSNCQVVSFDQVTTTAIEQQSITDSEQRSGEPERITDYTEAAELDKLDNTNKSSVLECVYEPKPDLKIVDDSTGRRNSWKCVQNERMNHRETACSNTENELAAKNPPPPSQHIYATNSLPHPSEVFGSASHKSRIPMDLPKEDLASMVSKKLENYQMKGSISGCGARRISSKSNLLPSVPFTEGTSPNYLYQSQITGSPLQQINLSAPSEEDTSMYVDWNGGKPKFTSKLNLPNVADIKVSGSPVQYVPRFENSKFYESPELFHEVPECYKYKDISVNSSDDKSSLPKVYSDTSQEECFGTFLKDQPGKQVIMNSMESSLNTDEDQTDSQQLKNVSITAVDEQIHVPSYYPTQFSDQTQSHRPRKALKSKPFNDPITHTSFNSYYFSPPRTQSFDKCSIFDKRKGNANDTFNVVQTEHFENSRADSVNNFENNLCSNSQTQHLDNNADNNCINKHIFSNDHEFLDNSPFSASQNSEIHHTENRYIHDQVIDSETALKDYAEQKLEDLVNKNCFNSKNHDSVFVQQNSFNLNSINSLQKSAQSKYMSHLQEAPEVSCKSVRNFTLKRDSDYDHSDIDHRPCSKPIKEDVRTSELSNNAKTVLSKWGKYMPVDDEDDDDFDFLIDQSIEIGTPDSESICSPLDTKYAYSGTCKSGLERSLLDSNKSLPVSNNFSSSLASFGCESQNNVKVMTNVNSDVSYKSDTGISDSSCKNFNKPGRNFLRKSCTQEVVTTAVGSDILRDEWNIKEKCTFKRAKSVLSKISNSLSSGSSPVCDQETSAGYSMKELDLLDEELTSKPSAKFALDRRKKFASPVILDYSHKLSSSQRNLAGELQFPSEDEVEKNPVPSRQVIISMSFPSVAVYKNVLNAALNEHLNIILFELAKQYYHALSKVDVTGYTSLQQSSMKSSISNINKNPSCNCGAPSKIIQVKKDGPNKGRFFYACNAARNAQCKFFQWADQSSGSQGKGTSVDSKLKLNDGDSITTFFRSHHVTLYTDCTFTKKAVENIRSYFKRNDWKKNRHGVESTENKKFYIQLSRKDPSSMYSRDDLWIISQQLNFDPLSTFLARSTYYGPNSSNEVEIAPVTGFSTSNWPNNVKCHCILVGNISSEFSYLQNIKDNLQPISLPVLHHLLDRQIDEEFVEKSSHSKGFNAPLHQLSKCNLYTPDNLINDLADDFVKRYQLNVDQTEALRRVSAMFSKGRQSDTDPILLIHGVFGAGKSYLLSVIVLFLVKIFEMNESYTPGVPYNWKILISSTTNVAVDRILNGLLQLGFEDFVRVGSIKKISKPVLPYSVHATGTDSQELKDLQEMLRSGEVTPSEKHHIRQSIEKHRLGENKKKLGKVKVVGVTCAASAFSCLDSLTFPVVLLDESSQMTEPASLLPIAKFGCQKLLLVGDPKNVLDLVNLDEKIFSFTKDEGNIKFCEQLDPAIQGSEAAHGQGLEQTLFDRLVKIGYEPTVLRIQYRCHPQISRIANTLFYNGELIDGTSEEDRAPLSEEFPTLCFYDVSCGKECTDSAGSYYNEQEAEFIVFLIQVLVCSGVEPCNIGVITLYKSQMYKVITTLGMSSNAMNKEMKAIQVSTVDAFQGGERDIILLSCVRTNNVGFIDNEKRTNVALTRARHHLLIVGNLNNLTKNNLWCSVIQLCKDNPNGVQQSAITRQRLQHIIDYASASDSTQDDDTTKTNTDKKNLKKRSSRKMQKSCLIDTPSPPMSLSADSGNLPTDTADCDSDFSCNGEKVNPLKTSAYKKERKSNLIDPTLLDSDKENSDEELPVFDI